VEKTHCFADQRHGDLPKFLKYSAPHDRFIYSTKGEMFSIPVADVVEIGNELKTMRQM
jgi:hypothetical protein